MAYSPKIFIAFLMAFFFLFSAQTVYAKDINIAVVDVEKILSESLAGKSIQDQLKKRRESFQKEFSAREDNLVNTQKTLTKQKADLNAKDFAEKRKEYEKQLLETRNLFQKRRNSLDKGLGGALASLRKHVITVSAEIANEKNYQIVLTRDSVVIVEKEIDITELVLARLNKNVSNIPLNLE